MNTTFLDTRLDASGLAFLRPAHHEGQQIGLMGVTKTWTAMWLLLQGLGFKATSERPSYPYSLPLHVTCRPGSLYSGGDLTFNPSFGEMLMGQPIGWSDAEGSVTGFARWLQRSRGELSRLTSTFDPEPA